MDESEGTGISSTGMISQHRQIILTALIIANIVPAFVLRIVGSVMYPFFIVFFLWAAVYLFTLVFMLAIIRNGDSLSVFDVASKYSLPVLIITSLLPRLAWIGSEFLISLDAVWYIDFGKFMSLGNMPYADFYFPYPPIFGYFIYAILLIAPTVDSYRILAILFDVAITVTLWKMVQSGAIKDELRVAPLLYAILPFAIIESGFSGHFEPIANIFILLSLWCVLKDRVRLSSVFLGLSIATKIYAAFLVPVYMLMIPSNRKKLEFILLMPITLYLTFIPFSIPVWLRGDLLLPGTAMPGLETGFFDALFGFIFNLTPIHLLTIAGIGLGTLFLVSLITYRSMRTKKSRVSSPLLYDILTLCLGLVFVFMTLLVWAYPLLPPGPGVFWRYPFDVALARGISTITGTLLLLWMAWRRWRSKIARPITNIQLALVASILLMLLVSMSKQVFYGWYLLWVLPPVFLIRDRRFVYLVLACMLLIYPSYTHDNFLTLGYEEDKTWSDSFAEVNGWTASIDLSRTNLSVYDVLPQVQSVGGIGFFSVDSSAVTDELDRSNVRVTWSKNVTIPVTAQTEFVIRESSNWDPTFGRYCDVELYFVGVNSTGHAVSWPIIADWQHSPSNITFWLWRFSFSAQDIQVHPIELTQLRIVVDNIQEPRLEFLVDFMYTTEVDFLSLSSLIIVPLLSVPCILAVIVLEKILPRNEEWYLPENDLSSSSESSYSD